MAVLHRCRGRRTIIANVRAACASRRGGGNARGAETTATDREAVTRVAAGSNVTRSTRRPTEGTPSSGDRRPGAEAPGDHPRQASLKVAQRRSVTRWPGGAATGLGSLTSSFRRTRQWRIRRYPFGDHGDLYGQGWAHQRPEKITMFRGRLPTARSRGRASARRVDARCRAAFTSPGAR